MFAKKPGRPPGIVAVGIEPGTVLPYPVSQQIRAEPLTARKKIPRRLAPGADES
jgi:hypothetical protein